MKEKTIKINYSIKPDMTRGKRPDFGIIEDHSGWTLDDVIDIYKVETKELDSYTERNVNAACIENGYFIHYGTESYKGYWNNSLMFISNWKKENISFIGKYQTDTRDLIITKYDRLIDEKLNYDDALPLDYDYRHIIKPTRFFNYIKDGKTREGFIVDSKSFIMNEKKVVEESGPFPKTNKNTWVFYSNPAVIHTVKKETILDAIKEIDKKLKYVYTQEEEEFFKGFLVTKSRLPYNSISFSHFIVSLCLDGDKMKEYKYKIISQYRESNHFGTVEDSERVYYDQSTNEHYKAWNPFIMRKYSSVLGEGTLKAYPNYKYRSELNYKEFNFFEINYFLIQYTENTTGNKFEVRCNKKFINDAEAFMQRHTGLKELTIPCDKYFEFSGNTYEFKKEIPFNNGFSKADVVMGNGEIISLKEVW